MSSRRVAWVAVVSLIVVEIALLAYFVPNDERVAGWVAHAVSHVLFALPVAAIAIGLGDQRARSAPTRSRAWRVVSAVAVVALAALALGQILESASATVERSTTGVLHDATSLMSFACQLVAIVALAAWIGVSVTRRFSSHREANAKR